MQIEEIAELKNALPTVQQIEDIGLAIEALPSADDIDIWKALPTLKDVEELNQALDETIQKLQLIAKLKQ